MANKEDDNILSKVDDSIMQGLIAYAKVGEGEIKDKARMILAKYSKQPNFSDVVLNFKENTQKNLKKILEEIKSEALKSSNEQGSKNEIENKPETTNVLTTPNDSLEYEVSPPSFSAKKTVNRDAESLPSLSLETTHDVKNTHNDEPVSDIYSSTDDQEQWIDGVPANNSLPPVDNIFSKTHQDTLERDTINSRSPLHSVNWDLNVPSLSSFETEEDEKTVIEDIQSESDGNPLRDIPKQKKDSGRTNEGFSPVSVSPINTQNAKKPQARSVSNPSNPHKFAGARGKSVYKKEDPDWLILAVIVLGIALILFPFLPFIWHIIRRVLHF